MRRDPTPGDRRNTMDRTWGEWLALTIGAVYTIIGLAGFAVTSGVDFAARDGERLLGLFEVNPFHNVVHLVIGVALIAAFLAGRIATMWTAYTIGVAFALLAIAGPFMTGTRTNVLALNNPDHWLHAVSALASLAAGFGASRAAEQTRRDQDVRGRDLAA